MQKSPGLKPRLIHGSKVICVEKINYSSYKRRSNIFPHMERSEIGR